MTLAAVDPHIRAIDIRHDLAAIADLIEIAFAGQMDAEGRDYLRHIRQISRSLGSYILDGNTPESSQFPFHGYLWEEDGRIIGNLTLIPVRKRSTRTYFIANVAVLPAFRGRGIARQLTDRAISHIKANQGRQVFLQVRLDNPVAQHIYYESGFEEFARRTTWRLPNHYLSDSTTPPLVHVSRRSRLEWQQQKDWLTALYPPEINWNLPYNLERLKPDLLTGISNFLNGLSQRSWSAREEGRLIGVATWETGYTGLDYVWLATSPVWEDKAIRALIPMITSRVFRPQRIVINYPYGRGIEGFKSCGMTELNTLIWMKKDIETAVTVS